MTGDDVLDFIKKGAIKGLTLGMPLIVVNEKLGRPDENVGDFKSGYLTYGIFSVGYFDDLIDELAILFYKNKMVSLITKENEFGELNEINAETKINEFIYFLNSNGVLWDCYDKGNLDYFIIRSEVGVSIVFDLHDGTLNKISFVQMSDRGINSFKS